MMTNTNKNNYTTLDYFFQDKEINFIKADIEGAEIDLIRGGKEILSKKNDLRLALCTYHFQEAISLPCRSNLLTSAEV
jgi:hypothetical protein